MKSSEGMSAIGASLNHVVATAYPIIVCALLGLLLLLAFRIVWHAQSFQSFVRRATGPMLPFIMLVFFFADAQAGARALTRLLDTSEESRLAYGLATGVCVIEFSRLLIKLGNDAGAAVAAFFFSFLDVFIMYSVVAAGVPPLHLFLFGTVMAAGIDIMFIGLPEDRRPRLPPPREKPHVLTARDVD